MPRRSIEVSAMLVVNNDKERTKIYLRSDVESNITNLAHESDEIQNVIAQLAQTMSGSPSGIHNDLIGQAQQSLQYLSQALQSLYRARGLVDQLDTSEEISDD